MAFPGVGVAGVGGGVGGWGSTLIEAGERDGLGVFWRGNWERE